MSCASTTSASVYNAWETHIDKMTTWCYSDTYDFMVGLFFVGLFLFAAAWAVLNNSGGGGAPVYVLVRPVEPPSKT